MTFLRLLVQMREIARLPLDLAPGEKWSYSNAGYVMLGALVRAVTGEFMATRCAPGSCSVRA